MNRRKKLIIALVVVGLATVGIGGAYAATTKSGNHMSSLVTAIASRFNLNASDVQVVFDEQRTLMHEQMQVEKNQRITDRINEAVTDGKLTQEQANKILAKMAELEANRTALEGKTPEEIRTLMQAEMKTLKQWASDNDIPTQYLQFGKGIGRGHGFGPMKMTTD